MSEQTTAVEKGRQLAFTVLVATCIVVCLLFLHSLMLPLTGALALTAVMGGVRARLLRRGWGTTKTAVVLVTATALLLVVPLIFVIRGVTHEVAHGVKAVSNGSARDRIDAWTDRHEKFGKVLDKARAQWEDEDTASKISGTMVTLVGKGVRGVGETVVSMVLMLFLLFFTLRDREGLVIKAQEWMPLPEPQAVKLLHRLSDVTYAILAGRFAIAGLQGLCSGLAYWLFDIPAALLWAIVTALLCLVPAFGAFCAWVPLCLYVGFTGHWGRALILATWCGLVIGNMDNFLYPVLVGKRAKLSAPLIFVSVYGGLAVFGFSGFVLGPVILATTLFLLDMRNDELLVE
ncbi:MAG: AI-2E family transporter [Acidobacteriaceae bacterium]|nr:AI-2E family transporter [Acidobacteriaceae bacterium]